MRLQRAIMILRPLAVSLPSSPTDRTPMTPLRATLVLAALALAAAPAPAQEGESARPQTCKQSRVKPPRPPRRADALEDSLRAALKQGVLARARAAGVSRPEGLLVFYGDPAHGRVGVRAHGANLPDTLATRMAEWAGGALARWPARSFHAMVRLDSLPVPEAPVGAMRTECKPAYTNGTLISRRMAEFLRTNGYVGGSHDRSLTTLVSMALARDGEVVYVGVERPSGDPMFDDFAVATARELRMLPARVDGVPVDEWVTMPFALKIPPSLPRSTRRGP